MKHKKWLFFPFSLHREKQNLPLVLKFGAFMSRPRQPQGWQVTVKTQHVTKHINSLSIYLHLIAKSHL